MPDSTDQPKAPPGVPIPRMIKEAVIPGSSPAPAGLFITLALLLANAIAGFWEERQAGNALVLYLEKKENTYYEIGQQPA